MMFLIESLVGILIVIVPILISVAFLTLAGTLFLYFEIVCNMFR